MMKKILILWLLIPFMANAQKTYIDEKGNAHLWGELSVSDLQSKPYIDWYNASQQLYHPEVDPTIANNLRDVKVKVFMGTWCGDSKRWVPRFIEQWVSLGLPIKNLEIIGVHNENDLYKQAPDKSEERYDLHRVPTFIFLGEEGEMGRIVESPVNTLFSDIAHIALGYPSEPRYKGVTYLASIVDTIQITQLEDPLNHEIARKIYRDVSYIGELNTYARKLYTEGRIKEAEWVYHLNTILYKYHPFSYQQMGAFYEKEGKLELAKEMYYKSLSLEPENENVISWLNDINNIKSD